MTILCWNSSIRARESRVVLKLDVSYRFQLGDCSDATFILKKPLPDCVDVLSCSDLIVSVSAVVDGCRWSGDTLKQSLILNHLVQYFRQNAGALFINNISDAYIDEEDGTVKVNLTPGCTFTSDLPRSSVRLKSIHLTYAVRLVKPVKAEDQKESVLNLKDSLLNGLMDRLVMQQLVRRYPLIFGPFGDTLTKEGIYFQSIARSLLALIGRSQSADSHQHMRRQIKVLRKRLRSADRMAIEALRDCCDLSNEDDFVSTLMTEEASKSDEMTIVRAMQQLFKLSVRRPRVKGQHVETERSELSLESTSADLHDSLCVRGEEDSSADLVFSDEDEGEESLSSPSQNELGPLAEWSIPWGLSPSPPSSSVQESPCFSDMAAAVGCASGLGLGHVNFFNVAHSYSAQESLKLESNMPYDSFPNAPAHIRCSAPSAARPDLDLHSHSDEDSDEDSIFDLSFKEDDWLQNSKCIIERSNASVFGHEEEEVNECELDFTLESPPGYAAKLKPAISSGAQVNDEHNGLHELTPWSNYELYLPSKLASCETSCPGANRLPSRPPSLHFSDDNSRSSSPDASLPELTEHSVPPAQACAQAVMPTLLYGHAIDSVAQCVQPSSLRSLASGVGSESSHSLYPGTMSHTDLSAVPGLDRTEDTQDEFDVCEWEGRATPHFSMQEYTVPSGSLTFRYEAEVEESGDLFLDGRQDVPSTNNLFGGPDCLRDLSDDANMRSDTSLHFDIEEDESDEDSCLSAVIGEQSSKGCQGSKIVGVEKVLDWEKGCLYQAGSNTDVTDILL